jgi:hypothetical protein
MTSTILSISGFALTVFGLLFLALARRHRAGVADPAGDPLDWWESFSASSYAPMVRLLDNRDYTFLASQKGYKPAIARRLRRQRIGIFQSYLGGMIRDFERLMKVARVIAVFAREDQTHFAAGWSGLRWRFYGSVIAVEARVALHWLGLAAVVNAREPLASLQRLETRTQRLIPTA